MKLVEKIKPSISGPNRYIYFMALICLGIVLATSAFLFLAKYEKSAAETVISNPNILKPDEIKKLSALMTSNGKHPYKILALPAATETKLVKPFDNRCSYNAQDYLPGDIVKTARGWIHCTPTLIFNAENSVPGNPAWTLVQ